MKNILYIFILFFEMIACCNSKLDTINNRSLILEENIDNILLSVFDADISPDLRKLLVTDYENGIVYLYDLDNGKILQKFEPKISFTDSLAIKLKNNDYLTTTNLPYHQYVTLKELFQIKGGEYDEESIKKWIDSRFTNACFINENKILITGEITVNYIYKNTNKNKENEYLWGTISPIVFVKGDLLNNDLEIDIACNHVIKNDNASYVEIISPYGEVSSYNYLNNEIITRTETIRDKNNINSYYSSYSSFSLNGKFKKKCLNLPDEFIKTGLLYNYTSSRVRYSGEGNFAVCYVLIPKIYLSDGSIIELKNFPNILNLNNYLNNKKLLDSLRKNKVPLTDFNIYNFNVKSNNSFILFSLILKPYSNELIKSILMEYDIDGNLKKIKELKYRNDNGVLMFSYYNNKNNKLFFFRKSNEKGWVLEIEEYD